VLKACDLYRGLDRGCLVRLAIAVIRKGCPATSGQTSRRGDCGFACSHVYRISRSGLDGGITGRSRRTRAGILRYRYRLVSMSADRRFIHSSCSFAQSLSGKPMRPRQLQLGTAPKFAAQHLS
jgi:hypothetical protein